MHPRTTVSILGSTGSIGTQTIDIISRRPELFSVKALTARNNYNLLIKQSLLLKPEMVSIYNEQHYQTVKNALSSTSTKVLCGEEGQNIASCLPVNISIVAIMGFAGLTPAINATCNSNIVGIANKESIVCAGNFIKSHAKSNNTRIIPLDSEHNAIFQISKHAPLNNNEIDMVYITASGGPFLNYSLADMTSIKPQQAIKHPIWPMGAKISIDSATLANKGLEIIEATTLFDIPANKIEAIIHPQSIVHAMISYTDGKTISCMGDPDMRIPIASALFANQTKPYKCKNPHPTTISPLTFAGPDIKRFPALALGQEAAKTGQGMPIIYNAANEVAVSHFLHEKIKFTDIPNIIAETINQMPTADTSSLDHIFHAHNQSTELAIQIAKSTSFAY